MMLGDSFFFGTCYSENLWDKYFLGWLGLTPVLILNSQIQKYTNSQTKSV